MKPTISPTNRIPWRPPVWLSVACGFLLGVLALWQIQTHAGSPQRPATATEPAIAAGEATKAPAAGSITNIYAHNLRLHQGPNFRIYVQWLRGQMKAARAGVIPSFDDPESFYLNVTNGVIRANMGDICNYLNSKSTNTPLTDIQITGTGEQVKITGKLHKAVTLPVEVLGVIKPAFGNQLQIHVNKINVLKIPFKAVLGGLHVTLASLLPSDPIPGVKIEDNDIYFDSNRLLPPPYIKGTLTKVSLTSPDLEAVYGDVRQDVARVEEWRNFLRLSDGSLNFGKLTMRNVDLIMIDVSKDDWFDLDLTHYQDQLVNGYSRMTPDQGLQIFMPDFSEIKTNHISQISIEWLKNRNVAPPPSVLPEKR
jgi:hypothetical protein